MSPGKTCVGREDFAVFGSNGLVILLCMGCVIRPQRDRRTRLRRAKRLLLIIYLAADAMFVWSGIHWPVDGRSWTALYVRWISIGNVNNDWVTNSVLISSRRVEFMPGLEYSSRVFFYFSSLLFERVFLPPTPTTIRWNSERKKKLPTLEKAECVCVQFRATVLCEIWMHNRHRQLNRNSHRKIFYFNYHFMGFDGLCVWRLGEFFIWSISFVNRIMWRSKNSENMKFSFSLDERRRGGIIYFWLGCVCVSIWFWM